MQFSSLSPNFLAQWQRFQAVFTKGRLSQSLLLVGKEIESISLLAASMIKLILCFEGREDCNHCKSCHLLEINAHPDVEYLKTEKANESIKIDDIRALQQPAYRGPQLGKKRVIVLNPAEKMNRAAANALLKLLEEPPEHLIFILIAEELSNLPATIVSRCQQWHFASLLKEKNYLAPATKINPENEKGQIYCHLDSIIDDLILLKQRKTNGSLLAIKWASYDFHKLCQLMYLINAELIACLLKTNQPEAKIEQLASHFDVHRLYSQLDSLNLISKKLVQNANFNQTLALEDWLFSM